LSKLGLLTNLSLSLLGDKIVRYIKLNKWSGVIKTGLILMLDESGSKNIGLRMNKTDYRDLQVKCLVTALTQKSQFDDTLNNAYFRRIQQNIPEEKFSTLSHHVRG